MAKKEKQWIPVIEEKPVTDYCGLGLKSISFNRIMLWY